jgi:hypothetical protein
MYVDPMTHLFRSKRFARLEHLNVLNRRHQPSGPISCMLASKPMF